MELCVDKLLSEERLSQKIIFTSQFTRVKRGACRGVSRTESKDDSLRPGTYLVDHRCFQTGPQGGLW